MPRLARVDVANQIYHVLNRANGKLRMFEKDQDYALFEELLQRAEKEVSMRILAYTIMPNHWHLVLQPKIDGDLGTFMHRLTNAHTRQVRVRTDTVGHGHLYQGRYKSFMVSTDDYLLTLIKYVEQNPVRAHLVKNCEDWRWGSAWRRIHGTKDQVKLLSIPPIPLPEYYQKWINALDKKENLEELRKSVNKGVPYGKEKWVDAMIEKYNLETTRTNVGRPKKS